MFKRMSKYKEGEEKMIIKEILIRSYIVIAVAAIFILAYYLSELFKEWLKK